MSKADECVAVARAIAREAMEWAHWDDYDASYNVIDGQVIAACRALYQTRGDRYHDALAAARRASRDVIVAMLRNASDHKKYAARLAVVRRGDVNGALALRAIEEAETNYGSRDSYLGRQFYKGDSR